MPFATKIQNFFCLVWIPAFHLRQGYGGQVAEMKLDFYRKGHY
jgi:hypothetical protein